jgi:hypothetical protein
MSSLIDGDDLPAHFPIGVDGSMGRGPVDETDPRWDHTECWCSEAGCQAHLHRAVQVDMGPPHGLVYVCEHDDEAWPCDHELELRREPPP